MARSRSARAPLLAALLSACGARTSLDGLDADESRPGASGGRGSVTSGSGSSFGGNPTGGLTAGFGGTGFAGTGSVAGGQGGAAQGGTAQGGDAGDSGLGGEGGVVNPDEIVAVTANLYHTCALSADGRVRCWGYGRFGALGYGNTNMIGDDETAASAGDVDVGGTAIQIAAGGLHTCALLEGGYVRCWGTGDNGQLGLGYAAGAIGDDESPTAVGLVDVGGTAIQLTAGDSHTCALLDDGKVRCWGRGSFGALGQGDPENVGDDETPASVNPVDVGGTVKRIVAGGVHTCALLEGGSVRCWGSGFQGQLGYADTEDIGDDEAPSSVGPVDVGGSVMDLALAGYHTCALLAGGKVRCWGHGEYGALGYGNELVIGDDETPASAGDVDLGGVAAGVGVGFNHSCAILDSGKLRCWGRGYAGCLGSVSQADIGDDEVAALSPEVDLGGPVETVVGGGLHTCALVLGRLYCFGYSSQGALGYGNTEDVGNDETPASVGGVPVF